MTTLPQTTTARLPQSSGPMPPNPFVTQMNVTAAAGAAQMSPADVWRVIRGNLIWIFLLTAMGGGAAWGLNYYLERKAPKYTAVGILQVQRPANLDPVRSTGEMEWAPNSLVLEQRTQAQLLLTEFTLSSLLQKDEIRLTSWFGEYAGDRNKPDMRRAREVLKENLSVTPIADSALLKVSFTHSVPADCKKFVEELVRIHLDQQREVARGRLDSSTKVLRELQASLNTQIKSVGDRVRNQQSVLTLKGMRATGQFSLKDDEMRMLNEAKLKMTTAESEAGNMYKRVRSLTEKGEPLPEVEKAIENDPSVAAFVRDVSSLKISRDVAIDTYGKDHPNVKRLDRLIDLTQAQTDARRQELRVKYTNQIVESLAAQSAQTKADLESISKRVEALQTELAELGKEVAAFQIAADEERGLRELRNVVSNRLRDIESAASPENQMRINWAPGGQPETPDIRSFPQLKVFLPAGLMIGLALALGVAFLREFLDQTVRSPRDIARVGHMNVLGIIAHESDDPQVLDAQLAIYDAPHSLIAEQFRQVRTRLQHVAPFDSTRSILISGPSPVDGKTTVAANLAAGLALTGRKVLLIDSNFRRPDVHRLFGVENNRGFSDVLNGTAAIADVAVATRIPNLSILPSGAKPMNATELFESQLLSDFIDHACEDYEHVIFDSGPLLVVAEAAALAAKVDGVVTVIRARSDSRGKLQRMCDELRKVRAEQLGVVPSAGWDDVFKTFYDYQTAA